MLGHIDELSAFILSAGSLAWVGYVALLLTTAAHARFKADPSTLFSLSVWIISDFVAIALTSLMYTWVITGVISTLFWYPSFIACNAVFSLIIFGFHSRFNLTMSKTSVLVLGLYVVLSALDLLMHIDRLTFLLLEPFYHFAVPGLKVFAVFLLAKSCYRSRSDLC